MSDEKNPFEEELLKNYKGKRIFLRLPALIAFMFVPLTLVLLMGTYIYFRPAKQITIVREQTVRNVAVPDWHITPGGSSVVKDMDGNADNLVTMKVLTTERGWTIPGNPPSARVVIIFCASGAYKVYNWRIIDDGIHIEFWEWKSGQFHNVHGPFEIVWL